MNLVLRRIDHIYLLQIKLLMNLQETTIYFEFATFLVALLLVKKFKKPFYKYFIMYISVLFFVELLVSCFFKKNNSFIYNIYTFFEFNLIALIFLSLTKEKFSHTIIKYLLIVFNFIYILSFIIQALEKYTVTLLAVFVSVFSVVYLRELLNSKRIINYKSDLSFWITVGVLLYYLPTIPQFYLVYIKNLGNSSFYILHYFTIITHLCFIYGLIWSRKTES